MGEKRRVISPFTSGFLSVFKYLCEYFCQFISKQLFICSTHSCQPTEAPQTEKIQYKSHKKRKLRGMVKALRKHVILTLFRIQNKLHLSIHYVPLEKPSMKHILVMYVIFFSTLRILSHNFNCYSWDPINSLCQCSYLSILSPHLNEIRC